jgi:hypothetical protein
LTNAETEIWERITASMPADHFSPGNASVPAQLCRHIAASDTVAMLIERVAEKSRSMRINSQHCCVRRSPSPS